MTAMNLPGGPIRLGLVGTGIFARDAHLPALRALGDTFQVVAVTSRTPESAAAFARLLPAPVEVYPDLDTLLAQADVEALDVVVPPDIMPHVLATALTSGKHVFSEKPVSPDVASARGLLDIHARRPETVWLVAENWRHEATFSRAAAIVAAGDIGRPLFCHWTDHFYMTPQNKYYTTSWRQSGRIPGGYLLDSGIHRAAVLRLVVGEVAQVCSVSTLIRPDLPPVDTMCSALRFHNGAVGTYSMTVAMKLPVTQLLSVVGDEGYLQVDRRGVEVVTETHRESMPVAEYSDLPAIVAEFASFAAAIRQGTPYRNTAREAVRDVALVEALLESAQSGRCVVPASIEDTPSTNLIPNQGEKL